MKKTEKPLIDDKTLKQLIIDRIESNTIFDLSLEDIIRTSKRKEIEANKEINDLLEKWKINYKNNQIKEDEKSMLIAKEFAKNFVALYNSWWDKTLKQLM